MRIQGVLIFVITVSVQAGNFLFGEDSTFTAEQLLRAEWEEYKVEHRKVYNDPADDYLRMTIFAENRMFIAQHNQKYENGMLSYSVEMNEYGDMTEDEFEMYMFGQNETDSDFDMFEGNIFTPSYKNRIPLTVDWREDGAVTRVKNQKKCGSCWSFSSAAALEGQHFLKTGYLVDLSEQNLIDCSSRYGNHGCHGGNTRQAFVYIKENGGINPFKSYPYEGVEGICRYKSSYAVASDKGYNWVDKTEQALKIAVATIGPISVSIDAKGKGFKFYKKGVYYNPKCSKTELKHAVLAIGYGSMLNGGDYWLVKNSWGVNWGVRGYIRMARNRKNHCGIANRASYPLVQSYIQQRTSYWKNRCTQ